MKVRAKFEIVLIVACVAAAVGAAYGGYPHVTLLFLLLALGIAALRIYRVIRTLRREGQLSTGFPQLDAAFDNLQVEREDLQKKLSKLQSRFSERTQALDRLGEAVVAVDKENKIFLVNKAAEKLFALDREQVWQVDINKILRSQNLKEVFAYDFSGGSKLKTEIKYLLNQEIDLAVNAYPLRVKQQGNTGAVYIFRDITEQKRLEQYRRSFLSDLSHEIRTPLTVIKTSLEALAVVNQHNAEALKIVSMLSKHSERLESLTKQIASISKLDELKAIDKQLFKLKDFFADIQASFQSVIEARRIKFSVDVDADLVLRANPDMLFSLFSNLINNSMKFNEEQLTITLQAAVDGQQLRIELRDDGCGVSSEVLARMFDRFYRGDQSRNSQHPGSGIGLSIVKRIVELHAGSVEVSSEEGKYMKFIIKLPYRESPANSNEKQT